MASRNKGTHFVITANATDDGGVVYLRPDRTWARRLTEAYPVLAQDEADALLGLARGQERQVCDPYAMRVELGPLGPRGLSARERIRGIGPTTPVRRPDTAAVSRKSA